MIEKSRAFIRLCFAGVPAGIFEDDAIECLPSPSLSYPSLSPKELALPLFEDPHLFAMSAFAKPDRRFFAPLFRVDFCVDFCVNSCINQGPAPENDMNSLPPLTLARSFIPSEKPQP